MIHFRLNSIFDTFVVPPPPHAADVMCGWSIIYFARKILGLKLQPLAKKTERNLIVVRGKATNPREVINNKRWPDVWPDRWAFFGSYDGLFLDYHG